jgi:rare lipoprotein A
MARVSAPGAIARACAAVLACLLVANCAKNTTNSRIDPKYGVSASERVVADGEPVPKGGGFYRVGKPYVVGGRTYVPEENPNYKVEGIASWYGDDFHGRKTANGEVFDMTSITAAHTTLPIPSYVRVTNLRNQRSLIVRVNDRGPYAHDRVIDLSMRAAKLLDFHGHGLAKVRVEYVGRAPLTGSDDTKLAGTLRQNGKPIDGRPTMLAAASLRAGRDSPSDAPKEFNRDLFDATPVERRVAETPTRTQRPYGLASAEAPALDTADEPPAGLAPVRGQTYASARADVAPSPDQLAPRSLGTLPGPVSAYAAPRYDGSAGMVSGRGLY